MSNLPPRPIGNVLAWQSSQRAHYNPGSDLMAPPARKGATDALRLPSRVGNKLHYPSGAVRPFLNVKEA